MTFRVGQKVVCINSSPTRPGFRVRGLVQDRIYTVRWVGPFEHPTLGLLVDCIRLHELVRRCDWNDIDDLPSTASRFRPIVERKTDISIFTKMLTPQGVEA